MVDVRLTRRIGLGGWGQETWTGPIHHVTLTVADLEDVRFGCSATGEQPNPPSSRDAEVSTQATSNAWKPPRSSGLAPV